MKCVAWLIAVLAAFGTGCGASGAPSDCGSSSWNISSASGKALFAGSAQCTRYSPRDIGVSLGSGGYLLDIQFPSTGSWLCSDTQVEITFSVPFADQTSQTNPSYLAGTLLTDGPPNGTCSFSVGDASPSSPTVLGTLTASVGRCPISGCSSAADWEYASINGSYQAYNSDYQGDGGI